MPMSPRLLRPRASGSAIVASDADARAYVLAVNAADGQPLEAAVQLAINAFVVGCKADGIWSAIKASCILMGARTLSGALTPLVGTAPTNNGPFVSADYSRKTGLVGNATTKYLDSNRAGNADGQNDYHLSVYASTMAQPASAFCGSGGSGTGATGIQNNNAQFFTRSRNATGDSNGGLHTFGFVSSGRNDANNVQCCYAESFFGGALTTATLSRASQTPSSDNFYIYGRNTGSNTLAFASSGRFAFYSIGSYCDLLLLGQRVTTLYNAIGAAIP